MVLYILNVIGVLVILSVSLYSARVVEGYSDSEYETWKKVDTPQPTDVIWAGIDNVDVQDQMTMAPQSYKLGMRHDQLQRIITDALSKEFSQFPNAIELNTLYKWKDYRPRRIPRMIYDFCILDFFRKTKLRSYKFVLEKARLVHANVCDTHYLFTYQIIIKQPSVVHGIVVEFTLLCTKKSTSKTEIKTLFHDANVIGLVHEQNLQKIPPTFSSYSHN